MDIGVVGLGKMGANIARNLAGHGHRVVGFDADPSAAASLKAEGFAVAGSLEELAAQLGSPRVLWVMVPSGEATDACLSAALDVLDAGDVLIDAGNSFYKDSVRHAQEAAERGVRFLDSGTSGGMSGARNGACVMMGGDRSAFEHVEPMLRDLCVDEGLLYTGEAGSGHFMKMVHNGIEYGMMQAIGEGLEILRESGFGYDLEAVAHNWAHGSVIRGWLMEIMERQLHEHPDLADIADQVSASGEAKWTLEAALDLGVPAPVTALSLMARNASQQDESFACKAVAALRNGFGGHAYTELSR